MRTAKTIALAVIVGFLFIFFTPLVLADDVDVTGIELDNSHIDLFVGQSRLLTAVVLPTDASNQLVNWQSDNEDIATVDADGLVTAVGVGDALIAAITEEGLFEATCLVQVVPFVPVDGIEISETNAVIFAGDTMTLVATVLPTDASNQDVMWYSDDENIATVNSDGLVLAVGVGETAISVITQEGSFEATCIIQVIPVLVDSIELSKLETVLFAGDTMTLVATVLPHNATDKRVTWTTSDDSVAIVSDDGLITALKKGKAKIVATSIDGEHEASCAVEVLSAQITSSYYEIDRDNGIITDVDKITAAGVFRHRLDNHPEHIVFIDGHGEKHNRVIGTGITVQLRSGDKVYDELTVIVSGDVNGDGLISITDYTLARLDILGLTTLDGENRLAADVNKDGKITISDYTHIRLDILGINQLGNEIYNPKNVTNTRVRNFIDIALAQQGKPYVWAASGPDRYDCSGYIYYCLVQAGYTKLLYRATAHTYSNWTAWQYVEKEDLKPGDLMFYRSEDDPKRIGHTGIYLGDGYHIHASSSNGCVIICRLEGWYDDMFSHGLRVWP